MLLDLSHHRGIWNSASASSFHVYHYCTEVMLIFTIHLQGSSPSGFLMASLCWCIRTWAALEAFKTLIASFPMTDPRGIVLGWPSRCTGKPLFCSSGGCHLLPCSSSLPAQAWGLGQSSLCFVVSLNTLSHWVFRDFIINLRQRPVDLA